MQTTPDKELTHQFRVDRAASVAKQIKEREDEFRTDPALVSGVELTMLMDRVFEPFEHEFLSALDNEIENLRGFGYMIASFYNSMPVEIIEDYCTRQSKARYQRVVSPSGGKVRDQAVTEYRASQGTAV